MAAYSEERCSKWLNENCCVNVKKEWLSACIEFLKQEHRVGFTSQSQLNNLVYEQLLMADFQEISLGSLPSLNTGKTVSTLQGKHTLQINSLLDVGQSAYSQIQKLKGKDDPEKLKENTSNNWETKIKPSRMLFLQLTDGPKSIQAMEYQTIPCLNNSIPPGTKVQIEGPVMCRLGVLLLTSKCVHILGGTVDELVRTNSVWKTLHNAIGQDAPEQPTCETLVLEEEPEVQANTQKQLSTDFNGNRINPSQVRPNSHQPFSSSNDSKQKSRNDKKRPSNFDYKENNQESRGKTNSVQYPSSKRPQPYNNRGIDSYYSNNEVEYMDMFNDDEDLFDDNPDENFDFDQLDQIEQEVIGRDKPNYGNEPDQQINSPSIQNEFNEVYDDDFMDDDFDLDDFDLDCSNHAYPKMESGNKMSSKSVNIEQSEKRCKTQQNVMPLAKKLKFEMSRGGPSSNTSCTNVIKTKRQDQLTDSKSYLLNVGAVGVSDSEMNSAQRNKLTGKLGSKKLNKNLHQNKIESNTMQPSLNTVVKKKQNIDVVDLVGEKSKSSCNAVVKTEKRGESVDVGHCFISSGAGTNVESGMKSVQEIKSTVKLGLKRQNQSTEQNTIELNVQQSPVRTTCVQPTTVKKETGVEVVDLVEEEDKDLVESIEDLETSLPFTYLSRVLKDLPLSEERTVRIKGYVSTLVSHTQVSDLNKRWIVTVKINDGTASVDATLGEEVLTELLGCSLESFQYTTLEAKRSRDPAKCQALQQQTFQFQRKLSQVSCLMDVLFSPSQSKPLVIRLTEASREDILGLISRVNSSSS